MREVTEIPVQGHGPAEAKENTFAEFFEDGYPRLVRALLPTTRDLGLAEELAQEAMARVFARWRRVGRLQSPIGYAYVVAINVNRRSSRRRWAPLDRETADLRPGPEREVIARDRVLGALGALPEGERDALLLVSYLGLSGDEAAKVLGIKPASVRSRVHRARAALLELKEEKDG
jgi:RNA polymerase sigma factor (sigma-70 family)